MKSRRYSFLGLALITGCASGSEENPIDFVMATEQSSVIAPATGPGTLALSIEPRNGFEEAVTLTVESVPTGFNATVTPATLTSGVSVLSYEIDPSVPAGTYEFIVRATTSELSRTQSILVHTPPVSSSSGMELRFGRELAVRQASSSAALVEFERGANAAGQVALTVSGMPAGAVATFDSNPTQQNTSLLLVSVGSTTPPGTYPIEIRASAGSSSATDHLMLTVVSGLSAPDTWVHRIELAQNYVATNPTLVSGRDTLVRAHVLTDGSFVRSPVVRLIATNGSTAVGSVNLTGPGTVPFGEVPSSLGMSFSTEIPAAWVEPGLNLEVVIDPDDLVADDRNPQNDSMSLAPSVVTGPDIDIVIVPLIVNGRSATPVNYHDALLKHFPLRSINITTRASYVVTSVVDVHPDGTGWDEVVREVRSLRASDGSSAYYYGVLDRNYGFGRIGQAFIGGTAAIGHYPSLWTAVHELGHNFSLRHAPCGDAPNPDPNFENDSGISGTWGYDQIDNVLVSPTETNDVMTYCHPQWISRFHVDQARDHLVPTGTLQAGSSSPVRLSTQGNAAPEPLVTIEGWIKDDGTLALEPARRAMAIAPPRAPDGTHSLALQFSAGTETYAITPQCLGCCAHADGGHFSLTVPDRGGLASITLARDGETVARAQQPVSGARSSGLTWNESPGSVEVSWDHETYPSLTLVHVGAKRTTLVLNANSGQASVSTTEIPPGGAFEFSLANGLNGFCVAERRF